jgi:hypothetical protein
MPTEQQRFNELLEERVMLEEKLQSAAVGQGSTLQSVMQKRIDAINAEMMALSDANVERQKAESAAVTAGQEQRTIAEQQRITDHQAELGRIETEKQAKIAAERDARAMTRAIKMGGAAGGIGGITEEVERKRAEQEELLRMTRTWQEQMETEGNEAEQRKIDARAQQTQQLLAFEDVLLKGKSDSSKEAYRIGVSLMDAEKRQTAQKILSDSYAAAMAAWKSLSGIPFIGPALGAAAAGALAAARCSSWAGQAASASASASASTARSGAGGTAAAARCDRPERWRVGARGRRCKLRRQRRVAAHLRLRGLRAGRLLLPLPALSLLLPVAAG